VAGCFDLVDDIYNARDEKPIIAICNEIAYSAAYAIASAAGRITLPRTGGVGSIGVICMHVDYSGALKDAGINVTMIKYGDRKGDGAAEFPLSEEAFNKLQGDINAMGELFVETVARNRDMSAKAVRNTQAGCYLGKDAIDIGLADNLASPYIEFENLINIISG
jgi:ClpP class serine protease